MASGNDLLENIVYRAARRSEWPEIQDLAWRTFEQFEAPIYTEEGIENFKEFLTDDTLYNMFLVGEYHVFVAEYNGRIIGMVSLRNNTHISLLFVDSQYHQHGIGSKLIRLLAGYTVYELHEGFITVNAAPYATGFYHKLGFVDQDIEQVCDGITYTPMRLDLI